MTTEISDGCVGDGADSSHGKVCRRHRRAGYYFEICWWGFFIFVLGSMGYAPYTIMGDPVADFFSQWPVKVAMILGLMLMAYGAVMLCKLFLNWLCGRKIQNSESPPRHRSPDYYLDMGFRGGVMFLLGSVLVLILAGGGSLSAPGLVPVLVAALSGLVIFLFGFVMACIASFRWLMGARSR